MQQGTRLRVALGVVTATMLMITMLAPAGAAAGNGNGNGNGHQASGHQANGHANGHKPKDHSNGHKPKDHSQAAGHSDGHAEAGLGGDEDAAVQAPAGAAGQGSRGHKHAAMQPCKKGGWRELQREDGTRFSNQGRCVSYAVHGGVLVPVVPVVTLSFTVSADTTSCDATATLADFDPSTAYVGTLLVNAAAVPPVAITTDALGDAVVPLGTFLLPVSPLPPTTLSLTVDGIASGDIPVACSPAPRAPLVPVV